MNDKSQDPLVEGLRRASPEQRCRHFLNEVIDEMVVYALRGPSGEWAMAAGSEGEEALAVWPSERLASGNVRDEWSGYRPEALDLDEFVLVLLEQLQQDDVMLSVLRLDDGSSIFRAAAEVRDDLEAFWLECYPGTEPFRSLDEQVPDGPLRLVDRPAQSERPPSP